MQSSHSLRADLLSGLTDMAFPKSAIPLFAGGIKDVFKDVLPFWSNWRRRKANVLDAPG